MYFTDVVKVLFRRWYVVLLGLLMVFGGLVYAVREVPTQYQATGQVLILLPPKATGPTTPTNPYMNLSPGLVTTATLIAAELSNNTTHAEMTAGGFTSEYAIGVAPDTGPLLVITAKDTDPAAATATREEVVRRVDVQLEKMQANLDIPDNQYMYTRRNETVRSADAIPGSKIRAGGVIAGGGLVLTVLAAFMVDRFARRRKAERAEVPDAGQGPPEAEEPSETTGKSSRRERKLRPAVGDDGPRERGPRPGPGRPVRAETAETDHGPEGEGSESEKTLRRRRNLRDAAADDRSREQRSRPRPARPEAPDTERGAEAENPRPERLRRRRNLRDAATDEQSPEQRPRPRVVGGPNDQRRPQGLDESSRRAAGEKRR